MEHTFCAGYVHEPYKTLAGDYPGEDVYSPADFRTEWGPVFHRGRLDGTARVLVLGQDPAAHESITRRICTEAERNRADLLVRRWGLLAVTATRPVPLLAETVAVVAGASCLGLVRTTVAAAAGSLPGALLYSVAGALGAGAPSGFVVFAIVIAIAAGLWMLGRNQGVATRTCHLPRVH